MSIITLNMLKKLNFNNDVIRTIFLILTAILTGIFIVYDKWVYLGILLIPFLVYFCIEKPFIFPFGIYAFALPLDSIFVLSGSGTGQNITKYLALLIIAVLILKGVFERKLKQPDNTTALLWTLFILWGVVSFIWAIHPETVFASIRNPVGLLILYLVVSSYKIQRDEYETLKWFIVGGGILAGVFSLYNYQIFYSDSEIIDRVGITIGEQSIGVNTLAYSMILPFAVCIEKILEQRQKVTKVVLGTGLAIILFSIVITGCRGAMLGVATIAAINYFSVKRKVSYIVLLIAIGLILTPFIPDFFFERWEKAGDTGGAGRLDIWYVGLDALFNKYLLIGAGLGNFPMAFDEFGRNSPDYLGFGRAAHNTFLEIIVELGVIGISLMVLAMWKSYQNIQSQLKNTYDANSIMLKATFWGFIVGSFTADNAWDKSLWLLFMMMSMYRNSLRIQSHNFPR